MANLRKQRCGDWVQLPCSLEDNILDYIYTLDGVIMRNFHMHLKQ